MGGRLCIVASRALLLLPMTLAAITLQTEYGHWGLNNLAVGGPAAFFVWWRCWRKGRSQKGLAAAMQNAACTGNKETWALLTEDLDLESLPHAPEHTTACKCAPISHASHNHYSSQPHHIHLHTRPLV